MSNDISEILGRKLADPETREAFESLLDNIGTVSRSVEWVKMLEETGMSESLQGSFILLPICRGLSPMTC